MQIYHYHSGTGEYLGSGLAAENPRSPGSYLSPKNSTDIAPPEVVVGFVAIYGAGAWSLVEDHRGRTAYDQAGDGYFVTDLGPLPDGHTFDAPPPPAPAPPIPLEDQKTVVKAQLADVRWQREEAGMILPDGTPLATDRATQAKLTAARLSLIEDPNYVIDDWKGPDGWVTLAGPEIVAVSNAVRDYVQAQFTWERQQSDLIDSAVDAVALNTIVAAWETEQ